MKTPFFFLLFALSLGTFCQGCKKGDTPAASITLPNNTYIAFFRKDSVAKYLTSSVLTDTTGVRGKLKTYTLSVLAANAVTNYKFDRTFYSDPGYSGVILDVYTQKDVTAIRADRRIDSLVLSTTFKAF
ncbi:MAG: hypothetical protein EOP45_03635 [Sphingobacteriaceae bacterium]|nr:MAG: hypothetical protein EOP45_03635 [Sphingobacteriaceae bacterium]